ncbi:MAG: ABC transporter permease [Brevinematales bacterium]|nr:ABC transporter permease [Brevinematales bacterium]
MHKGEKNFLASIGRTIAIAEKEWIEIKRDIRSLIMALVIPVFLLLLFAYALSLDIKNVKVGVLDFDKSTFSRQFISKFKGSEYILIHKYVNNYKEADNILAKGEAKLVIVIPFGFERDYHAGKPLEIQLLVDGSDSSAAIVATGYVKGIVYEINFENQQKFLHQKGIKLNLPLKIESRILYNPELASKNFIVPGIIVIVMAIMSAVITSLTIAREWERKTFETLITTPLTKYELFFGKLIPYIFIALFDVILTVVIGYFLFKVPIKGSYIELYLVALLFLIGSSSIGMLISTLTKSQILSIQISMILTYLPTFILSGYIFPIINMPFLIRLITYIVPAKYLITFMKGITLKGVGISVLWSQVVFLLIFSSVVSFLALKKIKMSLED